MSMIVDEQPAPTSSQLEVETRYVDEDGRPNVALLQDRTPGWMKSSSGAVWLALALGVVFLYSSILPLWHTDLWGHLSYGRWIVNHQTLPTVEPLLPLAKGMPFADLPWLSQIAGYAAMTNLGVTSLQFLNAACIVAIAGLLTFAVYRRTLSTGASLLTLLAFYLVSYQQLLVVRPQIVGMVCFALIFVMASSARWRRWYLLAIPALFAIWANMHGSFIMGLLTLGALLVGRAADVLVRTRSWKMVLAESGVKGLFLTLQLSAVAVLLNPYGIAIYPEVFSVSGNDNLSALLEWQPLTLRMHQGRWAAALALGLVTLYRFSPRRVTLREVLLLCGLGAAMLWHSRMIVWWAPIAAYYCGLHFAAVYRQARRLPRPEPRRSGLWSVVIVGIAWISFAYTPFGLTVLHGRPADAAARDARFRASVSPLTPVDIVDYLNRKPPQGLVFNTYEWGDYLLWAGPQDLQVYVNSHAHLIPEEVWDDYFVIANGGAGWESKLDTYGINAVVVDFEQRGDLISAMEKLPAWEKKFSDHLGAVFYRKHPIQ